MSSFISIQSHQGVYEASFSKNAFSLLTDMVSPRTHFLVDRHVANLYSDKLKDVLASPTTLLIDAKEENKSLEHCPAYIEHLALQGVKKDHRLVAVGGGILQDITCFLSAIVMRGLQWEFFPTTLLAQADSCIGSKSSINVGALKNFVGTFTPPSKIYIDLKFLDTLRTEELYSGIGEILKVHIIDGPDSFDELSQHYDQLLTNRELLHKYIERALLIKKRIIEADEFDLSTRRVMNYGHSFGHAIESATNFGIPHGIAVSIGMDMANYTAMKLGLTTTSHYERMHSTLEKNYTSCSHIPIAPDGFLHAITKDKKNTDSHLVLILPNTEGKIEITPCSNTKEFQETCREFLSNLGRHS